MPDSTVDSKRQPFGDAAKFFPVAFIVCNMVGLYLIYMIFHIVPMLRDAETHDRGIFECVFFNVLTFFLVLCYLQCILVHPGTIPEKDQKWEYVPQDGRSVNESSLNLQEKKRSGERRHCKWCAKYKPDRCHHCRVCRMCILKMDHHCPWIYNCVGFRNHKYFFLFVFYAAVVCQFITWTMLESVRNSIENSTSFVSMFLLLFGETLAAFMGILVTGFFGFHVWLMLKAMTTIEFCEKSMKKTGYNTSPFDRGVWGNVRAVLGDNPLLWLFPLSPPHEGEGVYFTKSDDTETTKLARDFEPGRGLRRKHHKKAAPSSCDERSGWSEWSTSGKIKGAEDLLSSAATLLPRHDGEAQEPSFLSAGFIGASAA
jgi:hypothetical protein